MQEVFDSFSVPALCVAVKPALRDHGSSVLKDCVSVISYRSHYGSLFVSNIHCDRAMCEMLFSIVSSLSIPACLSSPDEGDTVQSNLTSLKETGLSLSLASMYSGRCRGILTSFFTDGNTVELFCKTTSEIRPPQH